MIFIVICLGFILKLKRMGIKAFLIELIVLAENMFSYGKNEEKFQFVVNHLYEIFPLWLKIILPDVNLFSSLFHISSPVSPE